MVNEAVAIGATNLFSEQAIMLDMLVDITPPKLRAGFLPQPDLDPSKFYDVMNIEQEAEEEETKQDIKLNEYVFLLDRSGSMSGAPISLAVKALKLFLHSLPLGCKFNIFSFGSDYEQVFMKSQTYNQESLDRAEEIVSSFEADLGGTEIYEPLQAILVDEPDP